MGEIGKTKTMFIWVFIGRTGVEAEAPVLWPLDAKSQLIRKDPDAGKDWRQEEPGTTEDEMVGWHHWLNGCEFEQTPGDSEGQGSLACCSPRSCKESNTTELWREPAVVSLVYPFGQALFWLPGLDYRVIAEMQIQRQEGGQRWSTYRQTPESSRSSEERLSSQFISILIFQVFYYPAWHQWKTN